MTEFKPLDSLLKIPRASIISVLDHVLTGMASKYSGFFAVVLYIVFGEHFKPKEQSLNNLIIY